MNPNLKQALRELLETDINLQSFTIKESKLQYYGFNHIEQLPVTVGYCEEFFVESDKSALIAVFRKKFKQIIEKYSSVEELCSLVKDWTPDGYEIILSRYQIMN